MTLKCIETKQMHLITPMDRPSQSGVFENGLCRESEERVSALSMWQPLTFGDRKRLEQLLDKFEQVGNMMAEDYREVLRYMVVHDCKLEQEGNFGGFFGCN